MDVPVERFGIDKRVVEAEFTTSNVLPVEAESPQTESVAYGELVPIAILLPDWNTTELPRSAGVPLVLVHRGR